MNQLTSRGLRFILSAALVLLLGVWLRDPLLGSVSLIGFGYLVLQIQQMRHESQEMITVSPLVISLTVIAGETSSEVLQITSDSNLEWTLDFDIEYLSAKPDLIHVGENMVELVYSPVLGSVKQVKKIHLTSFDRYKLIQSTKTLDVDYTLTAYPRVYPVAARALETLTQMGQGTQGEQVTNLRGGGLEFAESRPYQPGDPLNRFDWKAYAKTTRPMVKEYYIDGGGGTSITYDNHADNLVSLDELNSAFLQLVLTLTQGETQIQINLLREDETYDLDRYNTLLLATQIALRGHTEQFIQYYTLIEPRTRRISLFQRLLNQKIHSTSRTINGEYQTNIIITSLMGNPRQIFDSVEGLDSHNISLLIPTLPWKWQNTLQQTNQAYQIVQKNLRILQPRGLKHYYSLELLLNKVEKREKNQYAF